MGRREDEAPGQSWTEEVAGPAFQPGQQLSVYMLYCPPVVSSSQAMAFVFVLTSPEPNPVSSTQEMP